MPEFSSHPSTPDTPYLVCGFCLQFPHKPFCKLSSSNLPSVTLKSDWTKDVRLVADSILSPQLPFCLYLDLNRDTVWSGRKNRWQAEGWKGWNKGCGTSEKTSSYEEAAGPFCVEASVCVVVCVCACLYTFLCAPKSQGFWLLLHWSHCLQRLWLTDNKTGTVMWKNKKTYVMISVCEFVISTSRMSSLSHVVKKPVELHVHQPTRRARTRAFTVRAAVPAEFRRLWSDCEKLPPWK